MADQDRLRALLASVGAEFAGAGRQLARVPSTLGRAALQALDLPRAIMHSAGYAPHEIQQTMGQLAFLPQAPGMGTTVRSLPRLEGLGGAPGQINLGGFQTGRVVPQDVPQMLEGLQAMPEALRQLLLRMDRRVEINRGLPELMERKLGSYLPGAQVIQFRPVGPGLPPHPDLPGTIAHEGLHAAGLLNRSNVAHRYGEALAGPRYGTLSQNLRQTPEGQAAQQALGKMYGPDIAAEEVMPWILNKVRGGQPWERNPELANALEGVLESTRGRQAALADLEAFHVPAAQAMEQTPRTVVRQRQAMRNP